MEQTKNYGLNKQQLEDAPDIEQIFENWETIDGEMKRLSDEKFDKAGGTVTGETTFNSNIFSKAQGNFKTILTSGNAAFGGTVTSNGALVANSGATIKGGTNTDTLTATGEVSAENGLTARGGATVDALTVEGVSRLNGGVNLKGSIVSLTSNNPFVLKSPEIVKGTSPDTRKYLHIPFYDKNGTDNNKNRLGKVEYMYDPSGSAQMFLGVSNPTNLTEEELNGLVVRWDENQKPYVGVMHQPEKASNDASVATTRWVKSQIATTEDYGLVRLAKEEELLTPANVEAAINPKMLYDLEDFRKPSTAYKVGDKVKVPFNFELFFECTTAGTTSAEAFDPRNVAHGQTFTDGSVVWTVRTHVRSVNGVVPDAVGDIQVVHSNSGVTVGTYNTVTVNVQGHVTKGTNTNYAKTINGIAPDSNGNVAINTNSVTLRVWEE